MFCLELGFHQVGEEHSRWKDYGSIKSIEYSVLGKFKYSLVAGAQVTLPEGVHGAWSRDRIKC